VQTATSRAAASDDRQGRRATGVRALGYARGHPHLLAAAIFAMLAVLMVGQGLLPGRTLSASDGLLSQVPWQASKPASVPGLGTNYELADAANVFQPFLHYTRTVLPSIPLWNTHLMAGRPLLADAQSAVFSPFSIPSYILPFWKSLAVAAILKLFLAGFGGYILGRALGMRFGGGLVTGLAFAFGTFFVVWLSWPLTSVYAFIPWTLALIELLVRRPTRSRVCGLAAALALQFLGGHPESSFHLVFVAVVFFVFRMVVYRRRASPGEGPDVVRTTLAFAIGGIVGAALAALALAPFLEFLLQSGDFARRAHTAAGYWPRKYLGALFLHDYWGRPTQVDLEPFMQVRGWYAGAVTLMLALVSLVRGRRGERLAVVVFALFCVCMVVGIPPVFGIVSALPGFSAAHNERLLIYVLLSLALLAGWGLDELSGALPRLRDRRVIVAGCAVILVIPVAWMLAAGSLSLSHLGGGLKVAWGFAHPPVPAPGVDPEGTPTAAIVRDSALLMWLPLAGIGLVLIVWRLATRRRLALPAFVAAIAILLAADLFRANMGFNPAIRVSTASAPVTGSIRYLQSRRPNRFIGVSTIQLAQPLPADLAMNYGLYDARGYDFPVEKRFDALWRRSVAPSVGDFTQPEEFAGATPAALRALDLLSVSDLLIGPLQAIKFPLHGPGVHVAYRGADAVVYANSEALPRVFLVDHQQTVSGENAALDAVTAPSFDRRGVAVTERPVPGIPQSTSAKPAAGTSATLRSYGAEHIVIDATAARRSLLVLTDDYYPGWTATVDGRSVPLERVDYLLRGVALGPGHHTIELRYAPTSWTVGWIISLVALLGVLAAVGTAVFARRRSRA
jgi:hypothetical protein